MTCLETILIVVGIVIFALGLLANIIGLIFGRRWQFTLPKLQRFLNVTSGLSLLAAFVCFAAVFVTHFFERLSQSPPN